VPFSRRELAGVIVVACLVFGIVLFDGNGSVPKRLVWAPVASGLMVWQFVSWGRTERKRRIVAGERASRLAELQARLEGHVESHDEERAALRRSALVDARGAQKYRDYLRTELVIYRHARKQGFGETQEGTKKFWTPEEIDRKMVKTQQELEWVEGQLNRLG
jgi:hypothetical protein